MRKRRGLGEWAGLNEWAGGWAGLNEWVGLDEWSWMCANLFILSRNARPIDAIYSVVREMADPDAVRSVSP